MVTKDGIIVYDPQTLEIALDRASGVGKTARFKLLKISPEACSWIIANRNPYNRHMIRTSVDKFKADMRNGHFHTTHQGIAFDQMGNLIDGQHRIQAAAEEGYTISTVTGINLPREIMTVTDRGIGRKIRDIITMALKERTGFSFERDHEVLLNMFIRFTGLFHQRLSTNQALPIYLEYAEHIDWAVKMQKQELKKKVLSSAAFLCSFVHARLAGVKITKLEDFYADLLRGTGIAHESSLLKKWREGLLENGMKWNSTSKNALCFLVERLIELYDKEPQKLIERTKFSKNDNAKHRRYTFEFDSKTFLEAKGVPQDNCVFDGSPEEKQTP